MRSVDQENTFKAYNRVETLKNNGGCKVSMKVEINTPILIQE